MFQCAMALRMIGHIDECDLEEKPLGSAVPHAGASSGKSMDSVRFSDL